jgi:tetratricopeptide (TPR) repeat protein
MASGRESRSSFLPLWLWAGLSVFAAPARVRPCDVEGSREFLARGELALRRGDLAGAEKAFRQALAADPKRLAAYANLGVVYKRRQHRHGVRVDGDVVPGEGSTGAWIDRALRRTGRSQGRVGTHLVEIATAFGVRRNLLVERERIALAPPFLGLEEEGLLFAGIVMPGNEDRPA